jgi:hypothetical protein
MTEDFDQAPAPDLAKGIPEIPERKHRTLWGHIAIGLLPAAFLLLVLSALFLSNPNGGGDAQLNWLIASLIAFVLGTPIFLIPWSHVTLKSIHGPIPPNGRVGRIGMIVIVTMGMCIANFVVVFAGCTTVLLTIS